MTFVLVVIVFSMTIRAAAMKNHTPKSQQSSQTECMQVNKHQAKAGTGVNRYDLALLLVQCDFNAPQPKDMQEWERMRPVGREF